MNKNYSALLIFFVSVVLLSSCQYEYSSPNPGTIDIRLRAIYSQFDTLFMDNNFVLKVTSIEAIRSDGKIARIYQDVKTTPHTNPEPDIYNVLGRDAYDSSLIIGQYSLPPASYSSLRLIIEPGDQVILDGYRYIDVDQQVDFSSSLTLEHPFNVEEYKATTIVITIDIDSTLAKLAYTFEYRPKYFISSVSIH